MGTENFFPQRITAGTGGKPLPVQSAAGPEGWGNINPLYLSGNNFGTKIPLSFAAGTIRKYHNRIPCQPLEDLQGYHGF
ncbi:hypothetical protein AGMMS49587_16290 [Spirochaetia bacterium]|nr:hypothetical protein AGMMS49587_16290 [Spirochaetia bacterium]